MLRLRSVTGAAAGVSPGPVLAIGFAAVLGVLVTRSPAAAVGLIGLLVLVALPFRFPVTHLVILLVLLAAVPYGIQNQLAFGGGTGSVGLVPSDLLLAVGLLRALVVISRQRLTHLQAVALPLTSLFLVGVVAQLVHGLLRGAIVSEAGADARTLLGYGILLVALPILNDERQRRSLFRALVGAAILLGLWGLAQWSLSISYGEGGNFGVRQGVRLTSAGKGQLLGGLYSYPVVVIMGTAVLLSGAVRARRSKILLATAVGLNAVCLVLTYERTFWLVTVAGCALVAVRGGGRTRWRAAIWAPLALMFVLVPLATLSPAALTTARERLFSVGQYGSDRSVYYRLVESRHVLDQITARPVSGSGLGASIYWGRPLYHVPAQRYTFVHNGYLYLVWKLGMPFAVLLVGALLAAALRRRKGVGSAYDRAILNGAQGAVVALLLSNVTFPSLTSLSGTGSFGLLAAVSLVPRAGLLSPRWGRPARSGSDNPRPVAASHRLQPRPEPG
jgi:O-antigen ligase